MHLTSIMHYIVSCADLLCIWYVHTYIHRMLSRRKLNPPRYHRELREEQSLVASHNRRHLEDMIASLLNHLQALFKQSVQYVA